MKRLADYVAVFCAVAVAALMALLWLNRTQAHPPTHTDIYLAIAVLAGTVARALHLAHTTTLALLVLARRGSNAIGWARPSECCTLRSWFFSEWDFFGNHGRQTGVRTLGLELSVRGQLR